MNEYIYICIYECMHAHTHTYIYMYIYIYTQIKMQLCECAGDRRFLLRTPGKAAT